MHTTTWRMGSALLCALVIGWQLSAGAQDIFKCVEDGATSYQSTPCANGQVETRMTTGTSRPGSDVLASAAPSLPAQQSARLPGPWRRTSLTLGTSDDEVLNLPGWGRPSRITRVKVSRAWHEEWTYGQSATDECHLHFANARLVDIVGKPPVDQVAQLTLH